MPSRGDTQECGSQGTKLESQVHQDQLWHLGPVPSPFLASVFTSIGGVQVRTCPSRRGAIHSRRSCWVLARQSCRR